MTEYVVMCYEHAPDDERAKLAMQTYFRLLRDLPDEIRVGANGSLNTANFSLEGPEEILRSSLESLFECSSGFSLRIEIDKPSYLCDVLSRVHPFFRTSSRKGHRIALELLEERGAKIKKGLYTGFLAMSVAKF